MTKIIDFGDFWVETLQVLRASLAANSTVAVNFTLEKPGSVVAITSSLDSGIQTSAEYKNIGVNVKRSNNADIVYGDALTVIKIHRYNDNAVAITFGAHLIVILKK